MGRKRRGRDAAKERRWRRMLREWRRSGLSVRDFCDWQGLSEPSFYSWRRELAKRDSESAVGAARAANGRAPPATAAGRFLPVQVVAETASESDRRDVLEVQFPSGVRLRVPSGFDRQTLADVLAALEARAC